MIKLKDLLFEAGAGRQITKAMDRQIGRLGTVAAQVVRQTPSFRNLPEFEVALKNVQLGVADVRDEEQRGAPARRSRPGEASAKLKNDIVALDRHFEKNRNRANLTTGAAATSKLWQLVRKMEQIQT